MSHLLWIACFAAASFTSLGQTPVSPMQQSGSESITNPPPSPPTAVTVQGMRQQPVAPPPDASLRELENTGDELRSQKAFREAIEYYRAAMKKADSAVLHNKIGIAWLQQVQLKEAQKEFDRAIKMDHNYAEAINNLGVVFYIRKKYPKAIKDYEGALAISPNTASFHSNLGMAYFERKQFEKASAELARALELDPHIFEHQGFGGVSARMASPEDRARYAYTLARIYASRGLYDRSLDYLKKAVEEGYNKIQDVYKDEVFAGLRKDPRFATVMAKTQPLPN
jgi:tetratricopeptide (TPR) repeat protein